MEQRQEIVFYHRYSGRIETEKVFGDAAVRWTYNTPTGRFCLKTAVRHRWFSALYGRWADSSRSAKTIPSFIQKFGIDPEEFLEPRESYQTFNEFFFRKLKPEARPIISADDAIAFPADGRHLLIERLDEDQAIFAKGRRFDLSALLDDEALAAEFEGGVAVISRLCPTDYHRFHFPLAGVPGEPHRIDGKLYSVNPTALMRSLAYLWENKRQVTLVDQSPVGRYLFIEIGATNVGGIVNTSSAGEPIEKGDEKGYFRFGGSMVITLFAEGTIEPAADLKEHSRSGIELYARMGDELGRIRA